MTEASPDAAVWKPRSFVERVGAALVAPTAALRAADAPSAAGKTGSDAALLILMSVVAIHTKAVVAAGWLGVVDGIRIALSALMGTLSAELTSDLVFLFGAGVVVTVGAGSRRSLGRDFDLACVAFVPFAFVKLSAALVATAAGWQLADTGRYAVTGLAYVWAVAVVALAIRHARARGTDSGATDG